MKIAVTGSSGLVGSALVTRLRSEGHQVFCIVRKASTSDESIVWDPMNGTIEAGKLNGADAVVHLAGENIASGRWTAAKKARIYDSRVKGTELLCQTLALLDHRPKALVSASAVGFYGDRGDQRCDESASPGEGYLAGLCVEWERATESAKNVGIRVVNLRIGLVLSTHGGALVKMLFPFKLGVGGIVGRGDQYWSWISLDDVVGAIIHCLHKETIHSAVNAVTPNAVTNREFTKVLGCVMRRPTILPVPAFAARIGFGEMADGLLLASARVVPTRLVESGYEYRHSELELALRDILSA